MMLTSLRVFGQQKFIMHLSVMMDLQDLGAKKDVLLYFVSIEESIEIENLSAWHVAKRFYFFLIYFCELVYSTLSAFT